MVTRNREITEWRGRELIALHPDRRAGDGFRAGWKLNRTEHYPLRVLTAIRR